MGARTPRVRMFDFAASEHERYARRLARSASRKLSGHRADVDATRSRSRRDIYRQRQVPSRSRRYRTALRRWTNIYYRVYFTIAAADNTIATPGYRRDKSFHLQQTPTGHDTLQQTLACMPFITPRDDDFGCISNNFKAPASSILRRAAISLFPHDSFSPTREERQHIFGRQQPRKAILVKWPLLSSLISIRSGIRDFFRYAESHMSPPPADVPAKLAKI